MSFLKKQYLAFICNSCFTKPDRLIAMSSNSSMYNGSLLCNPCFKKSFKNLPESEKMTWAFYKKLKGDNDDK